MDPTRWTVRFAFAAAIAAALVAIAPQSQAADTPEAQPIRAQELIGRKALDSGGHDTGWVEDLLLDPAAAAVDALLIAHDGRTIRIPVKGASFVDGRVRLAEGDRELDRAPRWHAEPNARTRRASKLFETPLRARDGDREIATVKDFLLDLPHARVTDVVVQFDPAVKRTTGWEAIDAGLVRVEGDKLHATFDPRNLHEAGADGRPVQAKAAADPSMLPGRDARLSRLAGREVKSRDGMELGRVSGVLVDLRGQRIAALLIDHAGTAFECRVGGDGLRIGRADLRAPKSAPSMDTIAGCVPSQGSHVGRVRARDLLRARIRDPQGNEVGRLADVVVKADDGAFHYFVGSFDPTWVQQGKVVGIPLRPVEHVDGGLAIRAGLMEMMRHPVFDAKRLDDAWSPAFAKGMQEYLGASR